MKRSFRAMGTPAWAAYGFGLGIFVVIALLSANVGVWLFAGLATLLGACFACAAPFIFGQRWKAPPPAPTRRPVVRKAR